jgi:hypothetical protein
MNIDEIDDDQITQISEEQLTRLGRMRTPAPLCRFRSVRLAVSKSGDDNYHFRKPFLSRSGKGVAMKYIVFLDGGYYA